MIITENIEIAFASLFRNKLRLFLTMLGIIIGVSSVILLISIGSGLQSYVTSQFESLGSNLIYVTPGKVGQGGGGGPPTSRLIFSMKDVQAIKRLGYPIKDVSGYIETYATAKYRNKEKTIQVGGADEASIKMMNFESEKGRVINNSDVVKNSRVAFLGPKIATELFGQEYPIGKTFLIQSSKYRVVGIFKSKGGSGGGIGGTSIDDEIFIPLSTAQRQFNQDRPTMIMVSAANKEVLIDAKNKVEKLLLKSYEKDDFSVLGQEDLLKTINQILGMLSAGLGGIAAISLIVGGIGIMNIMFVTVTERTKEIGLRKALGATPLDILSQFIVESIVVSVIGGTIGIIIAMLGSIALNRIFASEITPFAIILAFGFSSFIGIIFGAFPAWKAAKLDPITALRYE